MSDRLSQFLFISFHSQLHHCRDPSYVGQVVKPGYDDVEPDRTAVRSHCGKYGYDDVEPERTPVRSPDEKCMYEDLEENLLSTPTEDLGFIDKNS